MGNRSTGSYLTPFGGKQAKMSLPLSMEAPSGRILMREDLELIQEMYHCGFVRYLDKPVILSSGKESFFYIGGREDLTDNPRFSWLVGRKVAQTICCSYHQLSSRRPVCAIGIPTAGTSIAMAASLVSFGEHSRTGYGPISYRIMREKKKYYGSGVNHWVNGQYDPKYIYWFIDNVVTDGETKRVHFDQLAEDNYLPCINPWLIFVDRQQGGIQAMRNMGIELIEIVYYFLDINFAIGGMGLVTREKALRATSEAMQE